MVDQVFQNPILLPGAPTAPNHAASKGYVDAVSVTIGSTVINAGGTTTTLAGLTSLTSTAFYGVNLTLTGALAADSITANTILGDLEFHGDLLPDEDNVRSIGSPTLMWKDVYVGPGSLYVNGQKVLQDTGDGTIKISADPGQNISIQTLTTGDIELAPQGTGLIQLKGSVLFQAGELIRSSNGSALIFDDPITFSSGTGITGGLLIDGYTAYHSGNLDLSGLNPNNLVTLDGAQTVTGVKTFSAAVTFSSTLTGTLTGNASTATKLLTARTIAGVSFDGSANISIPFANLSSKPTTLAGYGIVDGVLAKYTMTGTDTYDNMLVSGFYRDANGDVAVPGAAYGQLLVMSGGGNTAAQVYVEYSGNNLYFRGGNTVGNPGGSWSSWKSVWHSGNFNAALAYLNTGSIKLGQNKILFSVPSTGSTSTSAQSVAQLASYRNSGSTTGALVFIAPTTTSGAVMHQFFVKGYELNTAEAVEFTVNGYKASTAAAWSAGRKTNQGTRDIQVRWGQTPSGNNCLILGDVGTVWSYPFYEIAHAMFSHTGASETYCQNWTTALVTDLSAYTNVATTITASPLSTSVTGNAATATALATGRTFTLSGVTASSPTFDGSGNVTIAVSAVPATLLSGTVAAAQMPALTGDVTTTAGSTTASIAAGAVTLAKMANLASGTLLGRSTAGSGVPEAITVGTGLSLSGGVLTGLAGTPYGSVSPVYYNGTSGLDCDTLTAGTLALVSAANTHAPTLGSDSFWYIETLKTFSDGSLVQRAYSNSANYQAVRNYRNSAWTAWSYYVTSDGTVPITLPNGNVLAQWAGGAQLLSGPGGGTVLARSTTGGNPFAVTSPDSLINYFVVDSLGYLNAIMPLRISGSYTGADRNMITLTNTSTATSSGTTINLLAGSGAGATLTYNAPEYTAVAGYGDALNLENTGATGINLSAYGGGVINLRIGSSRTVVMSVGSAGMSLTGSLTVGGTISANTGDIPAAQDLNNYDTPGEYTQHLSSGASGGTNYPIALAGLLEVSRNVGNVFVFQRYSAFNSGPVYVRGRYNGTWMAWKQHVFNGDTPSFAGLSSTSVISLGLSVAGSANDLTRHIQLYGSTYGFSITGNTINYVAGGGIHNFINNTNVPATIQAGNLLVDCSGSTTNNVQVLQPGSSATGSSVAITSPGSFPGITGNNTGNYRSDIKFGSGQISFAVSANGSGSGDNFTFDSGGVFNCTGRMFVGYDSGNANSMSCSGWFRSSGATGLYCASYAGGVYMTDTTYLRSYNNKAMVASDFVISSDSRLKAGVHDFLFKGRLRPVNFVWKMDPRSEDMQGKPDFGFIAQEVQQLYPEAVTCGKGDGELLKLSYPKLTAVLSYQVNGVEDRVEILEGRLAAMDAEMIQLKRLFFAMRDKMAAMEATLANRT